MRIINGKALKTTGCQEPEERGEAGDRAEQEGLREGGGPAVEVPAVLCTNCCYCVDHHCTVVPCTCAPAQQTREREKPCSAGAGASETANCASGIEFINWQWKQQMFSNVWRLLLLLALIHSSSSALPPAQKKELLCAQGKAAMHPADSD
ncbi:uncharacterized protein LOC127010642 [Drosophila biarmipes]|uniref:uncharacterized protein LOC127010642 n=1 Tax=Drosophila biarmipes TaxID=125945 RepID=UPI0021CD07A1|nr:uncharacterized protein LOC127010642 [Drosophila biarmipes]